MLVTIGTSIVTAQGTPSAPDAVLRRATGRTTVADAVAWIAEGHPLVGGAEAVDVLLALEEIGDNRSGTVAEARRRLAKDAAVSDLDTARELFGLDELTPLSAYRRALDRLAQACPEGSLANISAGAVKLAQQNEPNTIHVLCLAAGITFRELKDRTSAALPNEPEGPWPAGAVAVAFSVIDDIIRGRERASIAQAQPARPRELLQPPFPGMHAGWELVEAMRRGGVPYEVLLAQREVGGAWIQHRGATSSLVNHGVAKRLCELLDERGIEALRSTSVGGDAAPAALKNLVGSAAQNVGLIVRDARQSVGYAVWFATARDGGSVRKRIDGLAGTAQLRVPTAVVITGPGWSSRNETGELSRTFGGRVYTERTLERLADAIAERVSKGAL
jgi:hypothetical protein